MAKQEQRFSIAEVAEKLEIDARTIRKVLRANVAKENQPGRGSRWVIKESSIETLRDMIAAHSTNNATEF